MSKKILFLPNDIEDIVSLYLNGESIFFICNKYSVDFCVIKRTLEEQKVKLRTHKEAQGMQKRIEKCRQAELLNPFRHNKRGKYEKHTPNGRPCPQKSHPAWHKGLTKETDERLRMCGQRIRTQEYRENLSKIIKEQYAKGRKSMYDKTKIVKYKDINFKFNWEPKVAKWLDDNNIKWEYESNSCYFPLSNGRTYIIDFYLPEFKCFLEVKGRWTDYDYYKVREVVKKDIDIRIVDKRNINNINLEIRGKDICQLNQES